MDVVSLVGTILAFLVIIVGTILKGSTVGALVKPTAGGWLAGSLLPDEAEPKKRPAIRMRRQGETLRVVIVPDNERSNGDLSGCDPRLCT